MYVCGITPYDVSHIGHARSALVFDVVARYLEHAEYRVTFVKNYTDVDDKIIARANQLKVPIAELTERYIQAYEDDMARLGVRPPTTGAAGDRAHPRDGGADRAARGGRGGLRGRRRRVLRGGAVSRRTGACRARTSTSSSPGARVDVNERKRDPRDFALWKAAKPGEPSWPSPWGPGRPGWHIECSAMAMKYLGETLDLHGGGEDLIFPHHSCEIAQSEAATGKPFARFWLHNGFVNLGSEKMSKSLGNTLTIEALLTRHDPEALRLYLLQTHYRNPVEFTEEGVAGMRRPLERFRELVDRGRRGSCPRSRRSGPDGPFLADGRGPAGAVRGGDGRRLQHPAGDRSPESARDRAGRGAEAGPGGRARSGRDFVQGRGRPDRPGQGAGAVDGRGSESRRAQVFEPEQRARIDALVEERDPARQQRDWAQADALRAELDALGVARGRHPGGPEVEAEERATAP